ncbi:Non-heme 11 kDa protein of cytochrome bc1 complex [Lepidopterella palustris CBS 459.81]|uniref:Cytochrome b-c1 complex subunit 6, mitochondrial n=1 Tax=Lepidopterella palustris CBS 459.81 TaxID=1314670 RepID=A0A8E2JFB7_9PEZI|nr:Non-heme 11 kDa protein of cytochrome bc1 complex [Lepidopterella palustris CBS 459.81]
MGLTNLLTDLWDTLSTHPAADAEAPPSGGTSSKLPASATDEESGEEADQKEDGEGEQGHNPGEKEDEDEEEEAEEELQDPKLKIEEECMATKECAPAKHHYDECVERVTGQIESDGKAKEDCVEEFFHLTHCATNCAAPKLFKVLK